MTSLAPIAENLSSEQDAKSELEQRKSTTGKQLQRDIEGLNSTNTQHQADLDALKDYVDSNNEEKLVELNAERKRATAQMEKTGLATGAILLFYLLFLNGPLKLKRT